MPDIKLLAAALNHISEGFAEAALAIEQPEKEELGAIGKGSDSAHATTPAPVSRPAPSYPPGAAPADLPILGKAYINDDESSLLDEIFPDDVKAAPRGEAPQGSLLQCPKHKRPFLPSKFKGSPPYCNAKSDDPAWSKNGFCSINPKNVDTWLRSQAAAVSA